MEQFKKTQIKQNVNFINLKKVNCFRLAYQEHCDEYVIDCLIQGEQYPVLIGNIKNEKDAFDYYNRLCDDLVNYHKEIQNQKKIKEMIVTEVGKYLDKYLKKYD
jgi:hypothetical protein